jgi:hypothetical protein
MRSLMRSTDSLMVSDLEKRFKNPLTISLVVRSAVMVRGWVTYDEKMLVSVHF